jgi:hypothetical protein
MKWHLPASRYYSNIWLRIEKEDEHKKFRVVSIPAKVHTKYPPPLQVENITTI